MTVLIVEDNASVRRLLKTRGPSDAEDEFAQSLLTHLLPAPCRESHFHYNLNPIRCQRTTVSGRTTTNAHFHPYQSRRNITQNNLSEIANRGCGCLRFKQ
jgi:hypothetical protein